MVQRRLCQPPIGADASRPNASPGRTFGAPAGMNFSFSRQKPQSWDMRAFFGIVAITLAARVTFAADVRDLGVPAGWKASDYDRHGYDLLNKYDYENARRY